MLSSSSAPHPWARSMCALAACVMAAAWVSHAQAATLYVSLSGSDSSPCTASSPCRTINHAVNAASNGASINVAAGTYVEFVIVDKILSILGAGVGKTIISCPCMPSRFSPSAIVLHYPADLALSGVTVTNGLRAAIDLELNTTLRLSRSELSGNGRGIFNRYGTAIVRQSSITNNRGDNGAGIWTGGGILSVNESTISGNIASNAGGGIVVAYGDVFVGNSTIAHNNAATGGGITVIGGSITLEYVTLAGNTASESAGGIEVDSGQDGDPPGVNVGNTILANNFVTPASSKDRIASDCATAAYPGFINSLGHNLLGSSAACLFFSQNTDVIGAEVALGPLRNNGGPTLTMLPQQGSPVIDAGDSSGCTDLLGGSFTVDQRGQKRPTDGDADGDLSCDIGAVQVQ